jgi:hypothetical protein
VIPRNGSYCEHSGALIAVASPMHSNSQPDPQFREERTRYWFGCQCNYNNNKRPTLIVITTSLNGLRLSPLLRLNEIGDGRFVSVTIQTDPLVRQEAGEIQPAKVRPR